MTAGGAWRGALDARSALVTGASRGIGAATARVLAGAGARIGIVGRTAADLERVLASIGGAAAGHVAIVADLATDNGVRAALEVTQRWAGGAPDMLVNNAGVFPNAPAESVDAAEFEQSLRLNLSAPFALVRGLLPAMHARKSGDIVTIGSIADRTAFSGNTAYSAAKYGIRGMHEVLRVETRGSGVRAILVSPGPVDTDIWAAHEARLGGGRFPARKDMLRADDVARAILFAVSQPAHVDIDELRLTAS